MLSNQESFKGPFNNTYISFLSNFCNTMDTFLREVLGICMLKTRINRTLSYSLTPRLIAKVFYVSKATNRTAIVICSSFYHLTVTFTKGRRINANVFRRQRRRERCMTLNMRIFRNLRSAYALPFPAIRFQLMMPTITLP